MQALQHSAKPRRRVIHGSDADIRRAAHSRSLSVAEVIVMGFMG